MTAVARLVPVAAFAALLGGCLGEPPVEQRWTLLEIVNASPTDPAGYAAGATVSMRTRITYREVLTGFLVGELRESATVGPDDTVFDDARRYRDIASDVDLVLQNSVALGAQAVPVTGFDHLIHEVDVSFDTVAPTPGTSLFLLLYFSDDVEEVELAGGEEIEIIHPVFSTEMDVLSTGVEISGP